jgi:hypothetical protein
VKAGACRLVSPGRLEIRQGGGCLAIFGLPFFAAGIFVILIALGVVPVTNAEETPDFAWIALPLLGVVFTTVGGALVLGRSWTTIDAARRTLARQWGLLVPMRTDTHRLDDYTAVVIAFEAGDSDSADRFPVTLKPKVGRRLPIYNSTEYADSRACAVEVARLLHIDVEDATTDHAVRVPAAHSDLSLQQRLRLESPKESAASRPPGARSDVHRGSGSRFHWRGCIRPPSPRG